MSGTVCVYKCVCVCVCVYREMLMGERPYKQYRDQAIVWQVRQYPAPFTYPDSHARMLCL